MSPFGWSDECAACDEPKPPSDLSDAELNAAVAREVMGWQLPQSMGARIFEPSKFVMPADWSPATDIAAAMGDVVGEMQRKSWIITLRLLPNGMAWAIFRKGDVRHERFNDTPRAICESALLAERDTNA